MNQQEFKNFTIEIYSLPEIKKNLLYLQDNYNLNVNILLFCCWLGIKKNYLITKNELLICYKNSSEWNKSIVKKVRFLRTNLKKFNINQFAKIYEKIKSLELDLEFIEQELIFYKFQEVSVSAKHNQITSNHALENMLNYIKLNSIDVKDCVERIKEINELIRD
ncbi:TIGR02444 family protein [Alphaproteobacteria bacterium]|nr:TIGR02444 family protein [Alphaproteobacteria bacterium]